MKIVGLFTILGFFTLGHPSPHASEPYKIGELLETEDFVKANKRQGYSGKEEDPLERKKEMSSEGFLMLLGFAPAVYALVPKGTIWGMGYFVSEACAYRAKWWGADVSKCQIPDSFPCDKDTLSAQPTFCGADAVGTYSFYGAIGFYALAGIIFFTKFVSKKLKNNSFDNFNLSTCGFDDLEAGERNPLLTQK